MDKVEYNYDKVNQQLKWIAGIYRTAARRAGITDNEFIVWYMLMCFDENLSQQDISDEMALPKQTVNSIVSNLLKNGYVYFENIPQSRGKKIVRLTETGMKYGQENLSWIFEAEERAFGRMGEDNMQICGALLNKYMLLLYDEIHKKELDK